MASAQQVETHMVKGNEYFQQQQYAEAELEYRDALALDANNAKAQYNLAAALVYQDKLTDAQNIYSRLVEQKDKSIRSSSFYNQGVIHTRQKKLQESIDAYKDALRINPEDQEARDNLQKALQELKKQKSSENQQNKKQQQKPQSKMSQKEAERQLKLLEQKEKSAQERLQKQKERGGSSLPKDW